MDLSTLFRSVAKTIFPEAKIVADKFHVIRVVINSLENVRKRIQKECHATKRKWFKRSRYLLLKPEYKLTSEDKIELARMLNSSYDLEKAYVLKERFYEVFRKQTRTEAKKNWETGYCWQLIYHFLNLGIALRLLVIGKLKSQI